MGTTDSIEKHATETGLRRVMGPFGATCVVIGAIIGVGIFFTPSEVARLAGSSGMAMLAWACAGGLALTGALTYAELGGLYPRTGGQYELLRDSFGPLPAFVYVFCNATAIQAGAVAVIAIICVQNLWAAMGNQASDHFEVYVASILLIVGLAVANAIGVKWGSGIQNLTACAKVATLLVITAMGLMVDSDGSESGGVVGLQTESPAPGSVGLVFAAMIPAMFAFGGWQHALWIGGEIRRPQRNVPFAIIVGVVFVVTVYLLANWGYLRLLGYQDVADTQTLAADAVARVWPGFGRRVIAAAVALSACGVLNAQLLSGPRLIYGMALDGKFFSPFARLSTRQRTPVRAIALIAGMALVLLLLAGEEGVGMLMTGVVFVDGVFFALTGGALFVLRRTKSEAARSVRTPGYPVVPLLFIVGEIGILVGAFVHLGNRNVALLGVGWIVAAAVCYLLFFRRPRSSTPQ
jgi:APA family basic amino acid/polyamine antiporter